MFYQTLSAKESPGSRCVFSLLCFSIDGTAVQLARSVSGSNSKEVLAPTRVSLSVAARCMVANAVTRKKMGMQGWGGQDGIVLQMHRPSSRWLRALICAVYNQCKHTGKVSNCTGKTKVHSGDTRKASLSMGLALYTNVGTVINEAILKTIVCI